MEAKARTKATRLTLKGLEELLWELDSGSVKKEEVLAMLKTDPPSAMTQRCIRWYAWALNMTLDELWAEILPSS